jgi:AcrR family transcriptional regulator
VGDGRTAQATKPGAGAAPTRRRGSLTPDEIVAVAADMIRADGIEAFSMRRLGAALGVNPMTVYLRFEDREALLAAVAADQLGRFRVPVAEGPWVDRAVAWADAIRRHLVDARGLAALLDGPDALAASMVEATEAGLSLMLEAGLDGAGAVAAFRALFWHAVGAALAHDTIASGHGRAIVEAGERDRAGADGASGAVPGGVPVTAIARLADHFGPVDPDALYAASARALALGLVAEVRPSPALPQAPAVSATQRSRIEDKP